MDNHALRCQFLYSTGCDTGFLPHGSPLIPSLTTYSKFPTPIVTNNIWNFCLSGQMLLDPSLRPLSGTRIWTHNSKYRITIAKTLFIPPCPSTLILTLKQLEQLCARSDGCTKRKLKLKTEKSASCKYTKQLQWVSQKYWFRRRNWVFATNLHFLTHISLQPDVVNLWYFKLRLFDLPKLTVWNIKGLGKRVAKL